MSTKEQPYYNKLTLTVDGMCNMTLDDKPGKVVILITNGDGLIVQEIELISDEWGPPVPEPTH